jgi:hypothetical protein
MTWEERGEPNSCSFFDNVLAQQLYSFRKKCQQLEKAKLVSKRAFCLSFENKKIRKEWSEEETNHHEM